MTISHFRFILCNLKIEIIAKFNTRDHAHEESMISKLQLGCWWFLMASLGMCCPLVSFIDFTVILVRETTLLGCLVFATLTGGYWKARTPEIGIHDAFIYSYVVSKIQPCSKANQINLDAYLSKYLVPISRFLFMKCWYLPCPDRRWISRINLSCG